MREFVENIGILTNAWKGCTFCLTALKLCNDIGIDAHMETTNEVGRQSRCS